MTQAITQETKKTVKKTKQRLLSLDVFRGITVAAMILVNHPGSWSAIYPPLEHASWHGCTPTDLIFPFFLFIVGISIAFALSGKKNNPEEHGAAIKGIIIRSLKIFGLGFLIMLYPKFDLETVRIMGVLQRIGLVFLFTGLIFMNTKPKTMIYMVAGILVFYYLVMNFIPVPGVGYANLERETNLGAWIDRLILTTKHTWKLSITWDPEGLLGTIPAVGTGLLGVLCGVWMKKEGDSAYKIAWLFVSGFLGAIAGLLWGLFFPINKSLWTSSYVLYTAGLGAMFFGLLYWLIDVQGYKKWTTPFVAYGMNAITAYFFSEMLVKTFGIIKLTDATGKEQKLEAYVYDSFFLPYLSPLNASVAYASVWVIVFGVFMMWMYKRKIFIKI